MILSLILTLNLISQIASTVGSPVAQSNSTKSFKLQELAWDAAATRIYNDYVFTNVGILKIHATPSTWNDARNTCLDEDAHLTVIDSAAKEALLLKYLKGKPAWIGVHDQFALFQWTTIKDRRLYTLGYAHWCSGEPNNVRGIQRCVGIEHCGMYDQFCDVKDYFICEIDEF